MREVAALFVDPKGPYFSLPGVDPWGEERDARKYPGKSPVVAHPPCAKWGKFFWKALGKEGGMFNSALLSLMKWGGVLEHPQGSRAWKRYGLPVPSTGDEWVDNGCFWSLSIEQGDYGHRARKPTWLLGTGTPPDASLLKLFAVPRTFPHVKVVVMDKLERRLTPLPFARLLVEIARRS